VTKIVSLVILTFAVCWLPQHIRYALVAFAYPEPIIHDMRVLWYFQIGAQLLAYSNSCINPFLYGLLSEVYIFPVYFIFSALNSSENVGVVVNT